jgi:hypothetical protein
MSYQTKACPICRVVKRMSGETCSLACRITLIRQRHGAGWFRKAAIHASRRAKAARTVQREARWAATYPHIPSADAQRLYTGGYRSGYSACYESQHRRWRHDLELARAQSFEQGYRQAQLDALKTRRTA